ncbi:MAG: hypothetical protein ABI333_17305 [bacterium]
MTVLFAFVMLATAGDAPMGRPAAVCPLAVSCRFECVCHRSNGYRCFRYYTESCDGKACWQCQRRVTARARKSCSIGSLVRQCWCKFTKL